MKISAGEETSLFFGKNEKNGGLCLSVLPSEWRGKRAKKERFALRQTAKKQK